MAKLLYTRSDKDYVKIQIFYTKQGEMILDVLCRVVGLRHRLNVPSNIDYLDDDLIDILNGLKFGMYHDQVDSTNGIKGKVNYIIEKIERAVMRYYPQPINIDKVAEYPNHCDIITKVCSFVNSGPTGNPVVICDNAYTRITLVAVDRKNNTALLTMVKYRNHWFLNKFTEKVDTSDLKQRIEEILLWDAEMRIRSSWVNCKI